jgi:type I restriction enzyme, R subunit
MKIGSEAGAVQNPLMRYAIEMGWTHLSAEEALEMRGGETGLLLQEVFLRQVQKLNPEIVNHARAEDLGKRLTLVMPRIEGNQEAWEYLRGLKTVFVPEEKRERNVCLLSEDWEQNAYHVSGELRFYNGTHRIRLDVAFFINGIPVLLVETKAATKLEGIADALDQIRRYHHQAPELMALMQLHTLTHLVHYYYGPTWNLSRKSLFNWREESARGDFETLVKTFIHPSRVVRMISDFILFTRKDDELSKVIMRPHQMRAVERVVRRAADEKKQRGLIWHTQGSGKTYTMILAAKKIISEPLFENPTVLMLVDRNELEAQLFRNLTSVGFGNVEVARSKAHLRDLFASDRRGLIVSMIHKFDDIPANVNRRHNIFVLVDEAHRTTGGDLGNYLMGALPNATYIGFTGTPIDKTAHGKGTFKVFGQDDARGYLDKYSIAQSIEDGTTVPLNYSLSPSELLVDRETLDKEFLSLVDAQGMSDVDELNRILDKAVTLRNMLKNKVRMQQVAAHVANHFLQVVEQMGYKAFLVAVDREACAWYKDLLDQHLPPEYSAVVYSPAYNDCQEMARYHLSDDEEQRIRNAFRKPEELPKILIVTEKLLTGFDAPILYCMYLDKPMRDHVLLQAIARVNRPYEDVSGLRKPAGFVLDYVGIFEKLEKALAFDSEDVQGVVTGMEVLKERFEKMMEQARSSYLKLTENLHADKAAEAALSHFREEEARHEFYRFFRELEDLYEIISPDAFLRPYIDDYDQLARMYRLLRSAYESVVIDRELTRKTAKLVQEHTQSGAIQDTLKVYEINDKLLEVLAGDDTPDTVKIFNLHKTIQALIERLANQAPYLLSIGERAEKIIEAYQFGLRATQEALAEFEELIREINLAEDERASLNLKPEAFAIYWMLNRDAMDNAEWIARQMEDTFNKFPHWRFSDAQARQVRIALYSVLLKENQQAEKKSGGTKETTEITALVDQIMKIAGRAGEGS